MSPATKNLGQLVFAQHIDCGIHRVRVGVIAVIDDYGTIVQCHDFAAVADGFKVFQTLLDIAEIAAHRKKHGGRIHGVHNVVLARYFEFDINLANRASPI